MSRDKIIPIIISVSLLLIISFATLIPINYWKLLFAIFFGLVCVGIAYLIKKRSVLSINKRQVLLIMIICSLIYILLLVVLGLSFGFGKSIDIINSTTLISTIIPAFLIIISIEIIRRVLLSQETKTMTIMTFIIGVASDLLIYSSLLRFQNFAVFMECIGMILLPSVTANVLYTHVGKKYGTLPNICYRIIIFIYPYISTIVPATPDILESVTKLIAPLLIFGFLSILYTNKNSQKAVKKSPFAYVGYAVFLVLIISIAMLMSCKFTYGMLVIGSGSMSGEIEIGDAIIYKEYKDKEVEVGDIIVFERNDSKIVHRVVRIDSSGGTVKYYTKGDALENIDTGYVVQSDILGYVTKKIIYIGYPTLWLRELFA